MDGEPRVIRVDAGQDVSVADVAVAGARTGASYVLVEAEGVPISVLSISDLGEDDPTRVAERASWDEPLSRQEVTVELPNGELRVVIAAVEGDLAVLVHDDARFVVPLHGEDVALVLSLEAPQAFAVDTRLPGPTVPTDPQTVLYECELGHNVSQRADNPNRTCWCGHELEAA